MTKEECMQHFIDSKGRCHDPFNLSCLDCYFAGTPTTTDNCYISRFAKRGGHPEFRYKFALHYFNRKINKIKEILK